MTPELPVDYYRVLDVEQNATPESIRKSYIRAKNAFRRNSMATYSLFDEEDTQKELKLIEEAYFVLSDPTKRERYDRSHSKFHDDFFSFGSSDRNPTNSKTDADYKQDIKSSTIKKTDFSDDFDLMEETGFERLSESSSLSAANQSDSFESSGNSFAKYMQGQPGAIEVHGDAPSSLVSPFARPPSAEKNFTLNEELEAEIENALVVDGDFLRRIREYKLVSLDEMKNFTRLSKRYIQALEEDDYKTLPAPVFVRGFVVQYAKALKLDDQVFAKKYMDNFNALRGNN